MISTSGCAGHFISELYGYSCQINLSYRAAELCATQLFAFRIVNLVLSSSFALSLLQLFHHIKTIGNCTKNYNNIYILTIKLIFWKEKKTIFIEKLPFFHFSFLFDMSIFYIWNYQKLNLINETETNHVLWRYFVLVVFNLTNYCLKNKDRIR